MRRDRILLTALAFLAVVFFSGRAFADRQTISLDGPWDLRPAGGSWSHHAPVPGLVDLSEPRVDWRGRWFEYRRHFILDPASLEHPAATLKIDGALWGAEVRINGRPAGKGWRSYAPLQFNVRELLRPGDNEIVIRVHSFNSVPLKNTLITDDPERLDDIPGLWGSVWLILRDEAHIESFILLPAPDEQKLRVKFFLAGGRTTLNQFTLGATLADAAGVAVGAASVEVRLAAGESREVSLEIPVPHPRLWSPRDPYLYKFVTKLSPAGNVQGQMADNAAAPVGMRSFKIHDGNFFLNGERVRLFGGNIAFHRWLADPERRGLAWDDNFIRRVLVEIPRAHNMVFFRPHMGPFYRRWYDLADEGGILIQNEYPLWGMLAKKALADNPDPKLWREEYRAWMIENWNHPSVIIWDLQNESPKEVVDFIGREVRPMVQELDPTRPIEGVDFNEAHPYQWSLSEVLNDGPLGAPGNVTSPPFAELSRRDVPVVVNEFPWFWLDREGKLGDPRNFKDYLGTRGTAKRWLGPDAGNLPPAALLDYQARLIRELIELYRRADADAIQPFVYLNNNQEYTFDYFLGPLADLRPKPALEAMKDAFSPRACSLELWDRHFLPGEERKLEVYVFNDEPAKFAGELVVRVRPEAGGAATWETRMAVKVPAGEHLAVPLDYIFPTAPGDYEAEAELRDGATILYVSRKPASVFAAPAAPEALKKISIGVLETSPEMEPWLRALGLKVERLALDRQLPRGLDVAVIGPGMVRTPGYARFHDHLAARVAAGCGAVVFEPEFPLTNGMEGGGFVAGRTPPRTGIPFVHLDTWPLLLDAPGNDAAIWPTRAGRRTHAFDDIRDRDLQFFSGAAGEIVSDLFTFPLFPGTSLARSSIYLIKPDVFYYRLGMGRLIVSRAEVRGRLLAGSDDGPLARRPDPVAQRLLLNLLREVSD